MGVGDRPAGADVADRRAGGAPRRRGRGRPRGGRARHRDRPELLRQQADRGRRRREPEDVLPAVLGRARGSRSRRGSSAPGRPARRVSSSRWTGRSRTRATGAARSSRRSSTSSRWRSSRPRCCGGRGGRLRWAKAAIRRTSTVPNFAGAPRRSSTPTASGWRRRRRRGRTCAWLREQWDGPFMVKGVMRVDDARRAVDDVGATAISVSNHGGNNLDGTPASIRALRGDRRGGRRLDRGRDRRRRPPRQRRREGAGARRPGGDDRPRRTCGASPPTARPASRTCSTSCATASTPRCSASATRRCATSARTTS